MTAFFIYTILFISSLALKIGPLSRSTHLGLVYLSTGIFWPRTHYSIFLTGPFSFSFSFFLSFFLSFFFFVLLHAHNVIHLASCNLFRSNNFLALLAFIQAHSIYPIMASFLYTEQILFYRFPVGFGDRPVMLFNSFRPRWLLIYRPIVGLELMILLFYSPIKLTSLHRLRICCNKKTLPVGTALTNRKLMKKRSL